MVILRLLLKMYELIKPGAAVPGVEPSQFTTLLILGKTGDYRNPLVIIFITKLSPTRYNLGLNIIEF